MPGSRVPFYASSLGITENEVVGNCARCGAVCTVEAGRGAVAGVGVRLTDRAAETAAEAERRWLALSAHAARTKAPADLRAADAARISLYEARHAARRPRLVHRSCGGAMRLHDLHRKGDK